MGTFAPFSFLQNNNANGAFSRLTHNVTQPCTERHGDGWEIFTTPSTSCHSCGGPLMVSLRVFSKCGISSLSIFILQDLGLLERTNGDDNDLFNWPPMELPENVRYVISLV